VIQDFGFYRNRSHIIVKGLAQVRSSGSPTDQDLLKTRLGAVLSAVGVGPIAAVKVVAFPSKGSPVYDVELASAEIVASLIKSFYRYTRRKDPVPRPADLEGVALYHSVTPGTRVRISLLRVSN
jgi:hypothetical protein